MQEATFTNESLLNCMQGNLEMTLASRLSTMAHKGQLSDPVKSSTVLSGNLAMVQLQAIVIGTLASIFAMFMAWLPSPQLFTLQKVLLLVGTRLVASMLVTVLL